VDLPAAAIMTTIGPGATTVQAPVYLLALAVEAPVDTITFTIEAVCPAAVTGRICTARLPVQPAIDAIAFSIQAIFDAITAIIQSVFDAITGVCERSATDNQQCDSYCYCLPGVHNNSPLYPYKVVPSVGTTETTRFG